MKFVKGDAIAGIVIVLINIIGGLIIGNQMMGMSMGEAAKVFTLLSIGDGLVSQIPALFISICAGIVTTRVSSEEKDANLGREISGQMLGQPKALIIAAGVMIAMALLPGFPKAPFVIISAALAIVGYALYTTAVDRAGGGGGGRPRSGGGGGGGATMSSMSSSMDTPVKGH